MRSSALFQRQTLTEDKQTRPAAISAADHSFLPSVYSSSFTPSLHPCVLRCLSKVLYSVKPPFLHCSRSPSIPYINLPLHPLFVSLLPPSIHSFLSPSVSQLVRRSFVNSIHLFIVFNNLFASIE